MRRSLGVALVVVLATAASLLVAGTASAANVAAGKPVTTLKFAANQAAATDGSTASSNYVNMEDGANWLQVDFGSVRPISRVAWWHFWSDNRTYRDVVVQLSSSPTFASGVTTIFNNDVNNSLGLGAGSDAEYAETSTGRERTLFTPVSARYARFWSNGSSANSYNHVVEVQAFDDPVADTQAPSVPSAVSASVEGSSSVKVSWGASSDNVGVTQYVVTRNGADAATVNAPTTSWTDTGRTAGTTYTYTVRARDAAGNTSAASASASATIPMPPAPATNVAAGRPSTSLKYSTDTQRATDGNTNSSSYVNMESGSNWLQVDLGASYAVSRIKLWHYYADGRTYRDVAVQLSNSSTFASGVTTAFNNDTNNSLGLGTGSQAEYAETSAGKEIVLGSAVNARYVRFWSNGSTVNAYNHVVEYEVYAGGSTPPPTGDTQAPSVPSGAAASATSSSTVQVSWNASSDNVGVTQYVVTRNGSDAVTVNAPATSWTDNGRAASTTYTYTVRARDAAGNTSAASAAVSATTPAAPTQPTGMMEYEWHHGWESTTLASYPSDIRSETDVVIWAMSQSAGAGTGNLTMPPTTGYASTAAARADVESYKAQGKKVLVGFGGSNDGGITITNATQVTQAFNSIVNMVNTYGFNGVSIDLEPTGGSWNQQSIVSLAQQLKARFGADFYVDVCASIWGQYAAPWIATGVAMGSSMDTMSVMLYDFPEAGDSRLATVARQKVDQMVSGGVPASKVIVLFMMRPNASYLNSTPNPQLVVDAISSVRAGHPSLRGFGWWEDNLNARRGWDGPRAVQAAF